MSTQTPEPPPVPLSLLLSPVLWRLNLPDRYDMFSFGLLVLQLCFPTLRTDKGLFDFRNALANKHGYDLDKRAHFKRAD